VTTDTIIGKWVQKRNFRKGERRKPRIYARWYFGHYS